ncbi:MAG: bS18 family ribosomal protein [Candidatus Hodgkinia cicadicola]
MPSASQLQPRSLKYKTQSPTAPLKSRDFAALAAVGRFRQLGSFAEYVNKFYGLESTARPSTPQAACTAINFKNVALLQSCLTETSGIPSRLETGLSRKLQRKLAKEIKKCRYWGLLASASNVLDVY